MPEDAPVTTASGRLFVITGADDVCVLDRSGGDFLVLRPLEAVRGAALDLVALGAGPGGPERAAGHIEDDPGHQGHDEDDHHQQDCDSASHTSGATQAAARA